MGQVSTPIIALITACFTVISFGLQASTLAQVETPTPKNIIIMIGDGMGPAYTSAYRYYKDNPSTNEVEETVFDRLLVGTSSTYPAKESGYITDSAAAATALATGEKSYNGAISVNAQHQPLTTLFELAYKQGKKTGIAVTSQVNHATPAAFMSHNESRRNYEQIAKSYLNSNTDVILGGGQRYFPKSLLQQFQSQGYQTLTNIEQLSSSSSKKVLGLFADVQLPWAIDDKQAQYLTQMTQHALKTLEQSPQGFVLLVEGSLIDWAGHDNDIATAMHELDEFASAIEVAEQYVRQNPQTLLLVTADHSTGGMTVAANGEYQWRPEILKSIAATPQAIATQAASEANWLTSVQSQLGIQLTEQELATLKVAYPHGEKAIHKVLKKLIDVRSNTGWTGNGHTGIDVQVFAKGAGSELFHGFQDNTEIAQKLFRLIQQQN